MGVGGSLAAWLARARCNGGRELGPCCGPARWPSSARTSRGSAGTGRCPARTRCGSCGTDISSGGTEPLGYGNPGFRVAKGAWSTCMLNRGRASDSITVRSSAVCPALFIFVGGSVLPSAVSNWSNSLAGLGAVRVVGIGCWESGLHTHRGAPAYMLHPAAGIHKCAACSAPQAPSMPASTDIYRQPLPHWLPSSARNGCQF